MLGVGAGLLVAAAVAPSAERGDWLASASVAAFTAPLSLYSASDMASLGRWPIWSAVLVGGPPGRRSGDGAGRPPNSLSDGVSSRTPTNPDGARSLATSS